MSSTLHLFAVAFGGVLFGFVVAEAGYRLGLWNAPTRPPASTRRADIDATSPPSPGHILHSNGVEAVLHVHADEDPVELDTEVPGITLLEPPEGTVEFEADGKTVQVTCVAFYSKQEETRT